MRYMYIDHPAFPLNPRFEILRFLSIVADANWNVQARKCICLLSLLNGSRMCADVCLEVMLLIREDAAGGK